MVQEVFSHISNNKRKVGVMSTKRLMSFVQKKNCKAVT